MVHNSQINLLQKDLVVAAKFRNLTRFTFIGLGFYMFVALAVAAFFFFLTFSRSRLENTYSGLVREIQAMSETEGLLIVLKDRVSLAKELFSTTAPTPSELLQEQLALIPANSEVTAITTEEDGAITLTLRSQDSLGVAAFLQALREKKPTTVVLTSLNNAEGGGYLYSVQIKN